MMLEEPGLTAGDTTRRCTMGNKAEDSDDENEDKALMITPGTSSAKEEKESEAFFKKVQEIHEGLQSLRRIVSELENKQKTVLGEALPMESMKKELQTLRDEFKTQASQIQKKLKSIESKKSEEDGKYVPINVRMQRTQHGVLCKEFVDLMGHCNTIQAQYRDRNVERIQRQLRITGNDVSDTQLEVMLESGQTDVFTQNILIDAKATKQALNDIESRHDEILKLERSIRDLHDMFQYLAMEVEAQGEMVNRVENNINQSTNFVEKAKENTQKAVTYQQKARKKKLWIAICLAILVLILVITLVSTFGT
ncbi:syntaxin-4 isoform X1 [Hippoglossus stenolepis]|uniref:syntaxin-4 isoform X1 n=2 Tax=Hippoglossus stenolepis TaxID=195615 RepID=UPI00159C6661|nr:syntaxin-4 isoform X1 [Hippoglossus stenolepis]